MEDLNQSIKAEVKRLGGEDAAIDACDRMYQAKFRYPDTTPFGELNEETQEELREDVRLLRYLSSKQLSAVPEFSDGMEGEVWWEGFGYFAEEETVHIAHDEPIAWLCNYKGEGEGVALLSQVKSCPVFAGKQMSFFQVNGFS